MKKSILIYAALVALTMLVSCQKEQFNGKVISATAVTEFTATIEQPTKTAIDATGKVTWTVGDEITVTDAASNSAIYVAKSAGVITTFTLKDGQTAVGVGPYTAKYGDIASQVYDAAGANCPLEAAETGTTNFIFHSPYAVVKFTAKSEGGEVVKTVSVTYGENKSTLDCGDGVKLTSAGKDFYVAVEPANDAALSVTFHTADKMSTKTRESAATLVAKQLLAVTFAFNGNDWKYFLLPGKFSVSADRQVRFSPGNLYWNGEEFNFEASQYDFHGYDSGISAWGLFGWVGASSEVLTSTPEIYGVSTSAPTCKEHEADYGNDADDALKSDWSSAIVGSWSTLNTEEWQYLLGRNGKSKCGVTVCGKANCLVIAPDSFTGTIESSYDAASWTDAEEAGLVCLPAAGRRNGETVSKAEGLGYYWSSSVYDESRAYGVAFGSDGVYADGSFVRSRGFSVRLVKDVE